MSDFAPGVFMGVLLTTLFILCVASSNQKMPDQSRRIGHDQGVCDMHCGSRAEVARVGYTQLRCICRNRTIKMFEVTK